MEAKRAYLFKVLGVESRLRIIDLLKRKGPLCVNELAELLGISQSAVSQHLKVLKYAGLVRDERKGYWIPYDVDPGALEGCGEVLAKVCSCECCGPDRTREVKPDDPDAKLAVLREYERELRAELERIETRISELREGG